MSGEKTELAQQLAQQQMQNFLQERQRLDNIKIAIFEVLNRGEKTSTIEEANQWLNWIEGNE